MGGCQKNSKCRLKSAQSYVFNSYASRVRDIAIADLEDKQFEAVERPLTSHSEERHTATGLVANA